MQPNQTVAKLLYTFDLLLGPMDHLCILTLSILGTYICVDQVMSMLDNNKTSALDVFNTIYQLRKDRLVNKQFYYSIILSMSVSPPIRV